MSDKPLISFDYAIKYILRSKENYDIIEGFLSALFAAQGYGAVKINSLIESESNKEEKTLKHSIADMVVEDAEGSKYIVEIERSYARHFMHKACFNSSRLIVDSISGNQDYTSIKKVFHISLLYFATNEMQKPIYHGKTIMHEVDTSHPIDVRIANQGLVMFNTPSVFPEYFVISVPLFNDKIQQEVDEWLYVMKHSEVPKDFKSPYMQKVQQKLSVLKMSKNERNEYFKYLKESVHNQDALDSALEKGKIEGREEGREEGMEQGANNKALEIARNLLAQGIDVNAISSATGLTVAEIASLQSNAGKDKS